MYVEYEPGKKHKRSGGDKSDFPDAFTDCGWQLADNEVVIDIDHISKDAIRAMLKEFDINTQCVWTTRGAHLYFLKPASFKKRRDGICKLGFDVEQHTSTSRPDGMTIKLNGVMRQIDNNGKREIMPDLFEVGTSKKIYYDMNGLGEGDGRNKKLFSHRLSLGKDPNATKILRFINNYIFAEPMEEKELESVLRDMDTEDGTQHGEEYQLATDIIKRFRIVQWAGNLWWFNGTEFITDDGNQRLIHRIYELAEGQNSKFVDEVLKQLKYRSPLKGNSAGFPIQFKNGVLNNGKFHKTSEFLEFTPYFINIDYKPDAGPVEMVDNYINQLTNNEAEYRQLLLEALGFSLITDQERVRSIGKFFFFRGDGANGKGTLMQIIKRILNEKNCTNLSLKQLKDEKYQVTMLGKLANLGDDIEPEAIDNEEMKALKNITTADTVSTRKLYAQSMSVTFTVKLYFTTNSDLKSYEKNYAYKRRVIWMPMFNKVENPDPDFISKITTAEALEYWVRLIVEGYMRLWKNGKLTSSPIVDEYNSMYHESNNVMLQFAKDIDPDEIIGKTITEVRQQYEEWKSDDVKFSPKLFKESVWELYKIGVGVAKISGKSLRVFMRQDDTTQQLSH